MIRSLLVKMVLGLSVAILQYLILSSAGRITKQESINLETLARENMQISVEKFNQLFSETDSLYNMLLPLLKRNASVNEIEQALNEKENFFFYKNNLHFDS